MTSKDLKKLSRSDLLEILLSLKKENDLLRKELQQAQQELDSRAIAIKDAGSLAEAALKLNGVFEAAQAACELYTENVQKRCAELERQTQEKCNAMIAAAEKRGKTYSWLSDLMDMPAETEK